jgi:fructose-bisphosphate aldolase class II
VFVDKPGEFDPRAYLKPAKEAMRGVCKQRYVEFGAAGMASKIRVKHTSEMAKLYASGALDPKIGITAVAAE